MAQSCECGTSGFPRHMVFMRHMESESALVHTLLTRGVVLDPQLLEQIRARPDSAQRLSERGPNQAKIVGRWITRNLMGVYPELRDGFDAYRTSPYVRCRESVGELGIPGFGPFKQEVRLRERDRGEEGPLTQDEHRAKFPASAARMAVDPFMWIPPQGESVDLVSTARVRSLLGMIRRQHEEEGKHSFFGSTHGELQLATMAALYNWGPDEWATESQDPKNRRHYGAILHLSTINPDSGQAGGDFYMSLSNPLLSDEPGEWRLIDVPAYTPEELLQQAHRSPRVFPPGMLSSLIDE
jgi:broad specificity phosphatase PhoE